MRSSVSEESWMFVFMRGIQKVRSLIQLTTEYERDILSLFNIVPFNRNALGPAILQSLYSIVEEFLILVLQPVTRSAGNIITISKFSSFQEFLQFWKQKSLGAKSDKYDGWRSSSNMHFEWQSVLVMMYEHGHCCPDETTHRVATFLTSSFSVPLDIFRLVQRGMFL